MIALGQVTGELQDSREFAVFGGNANLPVVSSTKKYSGGYALRYTISSKMAGATFAAQSGVRCGAWLNHVGISSTSGRAWFFLVRGGSATLGR
jgi:hypothetical protein